MSEELNLDAIKAQYEQAVLVIAPWLPSSIERAIEAVPVLIAEVERLRIYKSEMVEKLAESSIFTAKRIGWSVEYIVEAMVNTGVQGVFAENAKLRAQIERVREIAEGSVGGFVAERLLKVLEADS